MWGWCISLSRLWFSRKGPWKIGNQLSDIFSKENGMTSRKDWTYAFVWAQ